MKHQKVGFNEEAIEKHKNRLLCNPGKYGHILTEITKSKREISEALKIAIKT